MADEQKSYTGLFASIDSKDDTTVHYLFYMDDTTYLKRYQEDWVPVDNIDDENSNEEIQVPVTDDFIAEYDKSEKEGTPLSIDDAKKYLRELEPWG